MALINRDELFNRINSENSEKWDVGVVINRLNALPLDKYSVFKSVKEAKEYVLNNGNAYPGQFIVVIPENKDPIPYIINVDGTLQLIGGKEDSEPNIENPKIIFNTDTLFYEVGSYTTPRFSISFDKGNYEFGPKDNGVEFSDTWSITCGDQTIKNVTESIFNYTTVTEGYCCEITASIDYSDGVIPLTQLGNECAEKTIKTGTTEATKYSFYGYKPDFYGFLNYENDILDDDENIDWRKITPTFIRSLDNYRGPGNGAIVSDKELSKFSGHYEGTLKPSYLWRHFFYAYPSTKDGQDILYVKIGSDNYFKIPYSNQVDMGNLGVYNVYFINLDKFSLASLELDWIHINSSEEIG